MLKNLSLSRVENDWIIKEQENYFRKEALIMKKLLVLLLSVSLMLCCACGSDVSTAVGETPETVSVETTEAVSVETPETAPEETSETVYITKTGSKYHSYGCTYLKQSCIAKDLSVVEMHGYTPCSKCR